MGTRPELSSSCALHRSRRRDQSGGYRMAFHSQRFLPVMALSKIFRAKYKELMHREGLLDQIDASVWEQAWNVNCQAVGDGRDSLQYLAPYVFRVAIGNHRIQSVECHEDGTGSVTFTVKPSGEKHYRPMTVPAEEFIRRLRSGTLGLCTSGPRSRESGWPCW